MTNLERQLSTETLILTKKKFEKSKHVSLNVTIKLLAILIPLLQIVPTTFNNTLCMCTFSMPLFLYFYRFNLSMIQEDFYHFITYPGTSFIVFGLILLTISLMFKLINRNRLIKIGPYKYLKHPQYMAICLITFGLTVKSINTRLDFFPFRRTILFGSDNLMILTLWLTQVLFYIILAKIQNFSSIRRFGVYYLEHVDYINLNWENLFQIKRRYLKLFLLLLPIYICCLLEYLNTLIIIW